MHLLILPFVFAGLSAKIINRKINKTLDSQNPEKQLDIIINSFFKNIVPSNFEGNKSDAQNGEATQETEAQEGYTSIL